MPFSTGFGACPHGHSNCSVGTTRSPRRVLRAARACFQTCTGSAAGCSTRYQPARCVREHAAPLKVPRVDRRLHRRAFVEKSLPELGERLAALAEESL